MGSGMAPIHGYMLKLNRNSVRILDINVLKKHFLEKLDIEITDYDNLKDQLVDNFDEFLDEELPLKNYDTAVTLYRYNADDGDCYDSLEEGQIYLWFQESDLFEKRLTPLGQYLKDKKLEPKLEEWTVFG